MHTSIGKGSYNKTECAYFNWGWTSKVIRILIEGQNGKLKWADIRSLTQSLMSWYCFF